MGISNLTSSIHGQSGEEEIYNIKRFQGSNLETTQASITNQIVAASIRLGRGSNKIEADINRGIRLIGNTTNWDDMKVPLIDLKPLGAGKDPTLSAVIGGLYANVFANAASEHLQFHAQVPHSYKKGTAIYPHVHFFTLSATKGTVRWDLEYSLANVSGHGQPATFCTPIRLTASRVTATDFQHTIVSLGSIPGTDPLGSPLRISFMLIGRLVRRGDLDSYNGNVAGLEIDFHYEKNSFGSEDRYIKVDP